MKTVFLSIFMGLITMVGFGQKNPMDSQKIRIFVDTILSIDYPNTTKDVWEAYENRNNPNFYIKGQLGRSYSYYDVDFKMKRNSVKNYRDNSEVAYGNIIKVNRIRTSSGDEAIHIETYDPKDNMYATFTLIKMIDPLYPKDYTYLWLRYSSDKTHSYMEGDFSRVTVRPLD
jgi:hypothetical protein